MIPNPEIRTVHCASCEAACSASASACPRCGHPLSAPLTPLVVLRGTPLWLALTLAAGVLIAAVPWLASRPDAPAKVAAPQSVIAAPPRVSLSSRVDDFSFGSLEDFTRFVDSGAWDWKRQEEQPGGTIFYTAFNRTYPSVCFMIEGRPEQLRWFAVAAGFPAAADEEQRRELSDFARIFAVAITGVEIETLERLGGVALVTLLADSSSPAIIDERVGDLRVQVILGPVLQLNLFSLIFEHIAAEPRVSEPRP